MQMFNFTGSMISFPYGVNSTITVANNDVTPILLLTEDFFKNTIFPLANKYGDKLKFAFSPSDKESIMQWEWLNAENIVTVEEGNALLIKARCKQK